MEEILRRIAEIVARPHRRAFPIATAIAVSVPPKHAKTLRDARTVELGGNVCECCLPTPPRRAAVAGEADGDVAPAVALGAHPHQVALLFVEPLHPVHRLQHAVDGRG